MQGLVEGVRIIDGNPRTGTSRPAASAAVVGRVRVDG